jgi:antitoxin PrlF
MVTSRITSRGRATIPLPAREALGLAPGDRIAYRIEAGRAIATRRGAPAEDPFAAFAEWSDAADTAGYAGF